MYIYLFVHDRDILLNKHIEKQAFVGQKEAHELLYKYSCSFPSQYDAPFLTGGGYRIFYIDEVIFVYDRGIIFDIYTLRLGLRNCFSF